MMKMKRLAKGLSLLLCLGIFVGMTSNNAWAKTSIADIKQNELFNNCSDAKRYVQAYDDLQECDKENAALESVQAKIGGLCATFQNSSSEYKKCTKGQKTTNDEATLRIHPEQGAAINERMQNVKAALSEESQAENALKVCEQRLKSHLSNASSAIKQCEKDQKNAQKATEKSEKANSKADDARSEYLEAQAAYENCVASKGEDACLKEYKKMTSAAKSYTKKQDKANEAQDKKDLASETVQNNRCPEGQYWDVEMEICMLPQVSATPESNKNLLSADSTGAVGSGSGGDGTGADTSVAEGAAADAQAAKKEATGKYTCPALSGENLFDYLACRITGVVRDLRMIVYILACFGMVGFAYSAIIGKINWKQLANIAIGLFILSMTTSIIEYIAYGRDGHGTLLKYGNHLPNGNHAAYSQNMEAEFDEKSYDLSGLDKLKSDAEGSSWSWKDLKSTIKSAKDAVDTAAKTYQTVKNTVNTTINAAKNISNAIKNGGNPLDVAATIASNVGDVTKSVNYAANMAASAASTISNDIKDARSSGAQREYLDKLRSDYDALSKKCSKSATACNKSELDALARLKTEMEANTTGTDKWLNNQGQNVLNTIGNVNNIAQKAETATQAAQQGAGKGRNTANKVGLGGTLGDLLSFGYGVTEGANAASKGVNELKENGSFDFRSQKTKDAEAEAAKAITDGAACTKAGGSMVNGACKCPEGRDMVNNKCQKIKGKKTTATATTSTATEEKKEESKTEKKSSTETIKSSATEEKKEESKTEEKSSTSTTKSSTPKCGSNQVVSNGKCITCKYGVENGNCKPCPEGYTKENGSCIKKTNTKTCPEGYTKNANGTCAKKGSATEKACPSGQEWSDAINGCQRNVCGDGKTLKTDPATGKPRCENKCTGGKTWDQKLNKCK